MIVERVKSIKEIYLKKYEDKILWFSFSFTLTDLMYPQRAPYKTYGIFELNKNRHINIALSYKDRNG